MVPARDEAPNLERLVVEVRAALDPLAGAWELIIVDDGSVDDTPMVAALASRDPRVRTLRLAQASGQTRALFAGFAVARGEYIATLDADLQCAPADLPTLLAALGDADLACGIRTARRDTPSRRLASTLSNAARRLLVAPAVRDLACPLRVFRRSALVEIARVTPVFDGAHRWLPALFVLAGLRVVQRPITHHPRTAGESKYTTRARVVPVLRELALVSAVRLRQSGRLRVVVLLGLLALVAGVLLQGLGVWPLMEPDEGRNAEVAREMLQGGQWSVPHFNGLPYLDKPVLLFWLIAAAFHVLGVSELAARLPSVLGALATIVATYDLGRVLAGRRRALVAAMVMATTPMLFVYAHLVIFDSVLTALVTGALCCLVRARVRGNEGVWLPLAGVAMGAATLTKGPVGVAVPLLAWWAARGALPKARAGRRMVPVLLGVLAFVAVVGPWVAVVARQQPDFLRYALLDETALRLVSTKRFNRGAPFYFYPVTLAWALGVWGIVLVALTPRIVRRHRAGGRDAMVIAFTLRATVAIVIFFTLSASKRPHYIFPALAPLAVLAAVMLTRESATAGGILRAGGRWAALAGVVVALVGLAGFEGRGGEFVVLQPAIFLAAGLFLVAWGALTALVGRRPAVAIACGALFAPGLGLVLLGPLTPYAEGRSSRALAASIEPDAPVVCFDTFRTSLPFYLRRPIMLASDTGRALTSNYVVAARDGLDTADHLIPLRALRTMLATSNAHVIVASRWNAAQVTRLSPRPLLPVYSDKSSIVFQQRG